ncbi:BgTH12-02655 [Blumeria graminis f. sp. triticale]|uniref:BgTH12-02655 n=1 Tax=Blumeria graminis f. sp. triticale TaxID=1689686 RepID=A0A9W4D2L0_BLUGR|nr:BgTH12-02655 [Blumeria graminis f. sp. triticale]
MHCVYAILFQAGKDALMTDRLVILHDDGNPFYGVYKPHSENLFPSPSLQHNLIISASKVSGPGTYKSLYCSPTLEAPMIKEIISQGLTTLSDKEVLPLDKVHLKLDNCRQQIIILSQRPMHPCPKTLNELLEWGRCSISHIITLAHEGKIFVNGYSNFDAPKPTEPTEPTFSIEVDREVKMSSIVSSDDLYFCPIKSCGVILGWSQGHLHVFKRHKFLQHWIQITSFGAGKRNVRALLIFLEATNALHSTVTGTMNRNNINLEMNPLTLFKMSSEESERKTLKSHSLISYKAKGRLPEIPIAKYEDTTLGTNKYERNIAMSSDPFNLI